MSPTLDCHKMPMILEGEFQVSSLVENNDLVIDEEPLLEEKQVEKQHLKLIMENVLIGVEDFNFPTNSLTFGMEEDRHDAEHGEMTLFVGEEKVKFNLHESIPLMGEERKACIKIKSSFSLITEQAPTILQEETLEGYNS